MMPTGQECWPCKVLLYSELLHGFVRGSSDFSDTCFVVKEVPNLHAFFVFLELRWDSSDRFTRAANRCVAFSMKVGLPEDVSGPKLQDFTDFTALLRHKASSELAEVTFYALQILGGKTILAVSMWFRLHVWKNPEVQLRIAMLGCLFRWAPISQDTCGDVLSGRWLSFEKWLAAPECMLEGESKRKTWRKVQVCDFVLGSSGHKDGSFLLWKCQGYSVHMWQHGISRLLWQGLFCTYLTFLRESEKKQKLVAGSWVLLGFVHCTPQVVGRLIVKCRSFKNVVQTFFVGAYSWWSWTNRLGTRHLNGFQRMAMWDIC